MTTATPVTCTPASSPAPVARLDAEKLDCYQVAVEAQVLSVALLPAEFRVLRDQLERASLSSVLNISEGAGRRSRKDKRRLYAIARGSAMECAAAVDVARVRGLATPAECERLRALFVRVIQMLTKLDAALA